MKIKLNLSQKLQIYIISVTTIFLISSILFISQKIKKTAVENAKLFTEQVVEKYSKQVEMKINTDLAIVRTLAQSVSVYKMFPDSQWQNVYSQMYKNVLSKNKQLDDIWDSWELSSYITDWKKPFGRVSLAAVNVENGIRLDKEFRSLNGDSKQYAELKARNIENIEEPYLYSFTGNQTDAMLITDLTVPINDQKGNYIGIVGADIRLEKLQLMVNKIQPYENSQAYLISHEGYYTSHPDPNLVGGFSGDDFEYNGFLNTIKKGKKFSFTSSDADGEDYFYIFSPINIGNTNESWSLGLKVPLGSIVSEATIQSRYYLLVGILIVAFISLVIAIIARKITQPLRKITRILQDLSKGKVNEEMMTSYQTGDEIESISIALNKSIISLSDKTKFAQAIGRQEYDTKLNLLSDDDTLGQSLVEMQNSLLKAKELEADRQKEDNKRKWANEGMAKFSEILRQNANSIEELTSVFTREIVKFNKANQATLFLENKEDNVFEAKATYAYDRDKYYQSQIRPGEGLVGTCVLEKSPIYITDIPKGYIKITSGLGDAPPKSLFICPIQTDKAVLGVLEMASLDFFDAYQIEFIETICRNLAGVVESVRVNENTKYLLEQTQQQAEEMKAQEEEMRQNLEELQTTQEEMAVKSSEMNGILNALNASSLVLKIDMKGRLIDINEPFLELLELPRDGILGENLRDVFNTSMDESKYYAFWENLKSGISQKDEQLIILSNGKEIWLSQVFSTIFDENNDPISVMVICNDITDNKLKENEIRQQNEEMRAQEEEMRQNLEELEATQEEIATKSSEMKGILNAIDASSLVLKIDMNGVLIDINEPFLKLLELPKQGVLGKNLRDFTDISSNSDNYENFWDNLRNGIPQKDEQLIRLSNGKELWLSQVFSTIFDENDSPVSVMVICSDISKNKEQEAELLQQNEEMTAQEEMMRLNMEEFEGIQTELMEKNEAFEGLINAIESSSYLVEYNTDGKVVRINQAYLNILGITEVEALTLSHNDYLEIDQASENNFWKDLLSGNSFKCSSKVDFKGKTITLMETYTPIKDAFGDVIRVLKIAHNKQDFDLK
ncbi:MAG: PAS domain-containing protein [Bacteroidales bacterium]|nr:PAS domain-containing protein [Bacteroidales bacterium]